jgi:hypothetical protein
MAPLGSVRGVCRALEGNRGGSRLGASAAHRPARASMTACSSWLFSDCDSLEQFRPTAQLFHTILNCTERF